MMFKRRFTLNDYLSNFWVVAALPAVVLIFDTLWVLFLPMVSKYRNSFLFQGVDFLLFAASALSLLMVIVAAFINFYRKRPGSGLGCLLALPLLMVLYGYYVIWASNVKNQLPDHFADELTIPGDIEISRPYPKNHQFYFSRFELERPELTRIISGEDGVIDESAKIRCEVSALTEMQRKGIKNFPYYVASNPTWRLAESEGKVFAIKRFFEVGNHWEYEFKQGDEVKGDFVGCQIIIGIGGAFQKNAMIQTAGTEIDLKPKLNEKDGIYYSYLGFRTGELTVEIFERSSREQIVMIPKALRMLQAEFAPVAAAVSEVQVRAVLPAHTVTGGVESFELIEVGQGMYRAIVRVNPGQPGKIFMRVYEITRNQPLSEKLVKSSSAEWSGFSDNPDEKIIYMPNILIEEGDAGKEYAARFEVHFQPDDGTAERKLLERNYIIEGFDPQVEKK